jgi:hypothetical protein
MFCRLARRYKSRSVQLRIQIKNFSTHQTAKVFAILMAVSSLVFFIPFGLFSLAIPTSYDASGNPINAGGFSFIF